MENLKAAQADIDVANSEVERFSDQLTEARAEIERLNKECISLFLHEQRMQECQAKLEKAKVALRHYADRMGSKARECLKEIE
jgi:peptidoglycan hydrolase CwlO-like protein